MPLLLNMLSRLAIAFLPRSKCLNFMAAVTICRDFGAPQNKVSHCFHCFPIYLPWSDGTGCHDLSLLNIRDVRHGTGDGSPAEIWHGGRKCDCPDGIFLFLRLLDWLDLLAESPWDSQASSPTPQFKSINSSALSFLYGPTLTSIHDYWENHSFD